MEFQIGMRMDGGMEGQTEGDKERINNLKQNVGGRKWCMMYGIKSRRNEGLTERRNNGGKDRRKKGEMERRKERRANKRKEGKKMKRC